METFFSTPQRQGPRTPSFPWTGSPPSSVSAASAASATPPRPFHGSFTSPLQRSQGHASLHYAATMMNTTTTLTTTPTGRTPGTPASLVGGHTPTPDRFIADRLSQDASISRFLLTAGDPVVTTPLARLTIATEAAAATTATTMMSGAARAGGGHGETAIGASASASAEAPASYHTFGFGMRELPNGPLFPPSSFASDDVVVGLDWVATSAPPQRPSLSREAWGSAHPLGSPVDARLCRGEVNEESDDHDDDHEEDDEEEGRDAHTHSPARVLHVASPLPASPSAMGSFAAATATAPSSPLPHSASRSHDGGHSPLFRPWPDSSRASSLSAAMRGGSRSGTAVSLFPSDSTAWSPPRRAAMGEARRHPSTSLPRGTPTRRTAQPIAATATPTRGASHSMTSSTASSTVARSGSAHPQLLAEAEPYTSKLVRTLFTDAVQTSVLGLHSRPARADQENASITGAGLTAAAEADEVVLDSTTASLRGDDNTTTSPSSTAPSANSSLHGMENGAALASSPSSSSSHQQQQQQPPSQQAPHLQRQQPQSFHPPMREGTRFHSSLGVVYAQNRASNFQSHSFRVIAQTPERILDAADMVDDFYLNLVDWSVRDVLCVALQSAVYLWEAASCNITPLPITRPASAPSSLVCGVQWAPDGRNLSLGFNDGSVEVWDAETQQVVQTWHDHAQRVGALSWAAGDTAVLATGSKDATIRLRDLRDPRAVGALRGHQQEVCGLRWSPNSYHLASGGNDNQVLLWDRRWVSAETRADTHAHRQTGTSGAGGVFSSSPRPSRGSRATPVLYLNQHTAAVKALAWNPVQPSLLVSGGGTDDRTLRFWNTTTGECMHSMDTGSQVCGVLWSRSGTELVSSHGFSMNQLTVWKYPSLRKMADLTGHTSRVLHLCLSADGEVVVSAAGDETIRFWRCFPPTPPASSSSPMTAAAAASSPSSRRSGASTGLAGSGSASPHGSERGPVGKLDSGLPYYGEYGSPDGSGSGSGGAAMMIGSSSTRDAAAGASVYASSSSMARSGYGSPLAGFSPRSGGRGRQLFDTPPFASDEVSLR